MSTEEMTGHGSPAPRGTTATGRAAGAFTSPAGLVAVVLIAVQAVWRGGAVAGSYFTQDDYVLMRRAAEQPLDFDFLTTLFAGELAPVANLIGWLLTAWSPMEWGAVVLVVVVFQAVAALLLWLVLTRLLADRWVRVPLLAAALLTPLTLAHTLWYSLALLHLPSVIFFLVAALALLARLQDGWEPGFSVGVLAVALALAASDHTLVVPLALLGVVAAVLDTADGVLARIGAALRVAAPFWVAMVVLVGVRLLAEATVADRRLGWADNPGDLVEQYVRQLATGLVGGPWEGQAVGTVFLPDRTWPTALAVVLVLVLALPFMRERSPAARVGALALAACLLVGALVLLFARNEAPPSAMASRSVALLVPVIVLLVAAALRTTPVPGEIQPVVSRFPGVVAVVLAVALGASAAVTIRQFQPALQNDDDRAYVDNIASALGEDPRIVLLDAPPPEGVLSSWFGSAARISTVTALLPEHPSYDLPSELLRMVDEEGHPRPVDLVDPVHSAPPPDEQCGFAVGLEPVPVPMERRVPDGRHVVRVVYFFGADSFATARVGSQELRFPARQGVYAIDLPVAGGFDEVVLSVEDPGTTLCVTSLTAGRPAPRLSDQP